MSFISVTTALNSNYALAIIFAILVLETGLPLIIGLPGDTLLISAGLFASGIGVKAGHHHLNITIVALGAPIAAIIGSQFGHWLGWKYGGNTFANTISKYLTDIIIVIAGITVLPIIFEVFKEWRTRKHLS